MTNKVQKIREEVERLKESGCASPIVICDTLLAFIDSLQEEPVSEELEKVAYEYSLYPVATSKFVLAEQGFKDGANWQKERLIKWLATEKDFLIVEYTKGNGDLAKKYRSELYGEIIAKLKDM